MANKKQQGKREKEGQKGSHREVERQSTRRQLASSRGIRKLVILPLPCERPGPSSQEPAPAPVIKHPSQVSS
jgi:hypothetical protein